ncbi:MAG: LysR substrate-binding domain-containing protein [Pseudomonadota bacterium]|nr:LysR substrate-binding domain-containing protein [Pseudomonadota bacterium]
MGPAFDIDALRAVIAGTDLGSFARAAVQLGRSQSAISMQLRKLEQQAGTTLFVRKGRGLVPTEAGAALVTYARRIVALNDEAALALGSSVTGATVRMGLPQDFFDDVMPATLAAFGARHDTVHVEVRAGHNYGLADEVRAGRLDAAIAFTPAGTTGEGEVLCHLPLYWLAARSLDRPDGDVPLPLVLFSYPCLFRQAAVSTLEREGRRWRAALTTPSLPGIWAALRAGLGVGVRTGHGLPADIACLDRSAGLPELPSIEIRLLRAPGAGTLAQELGDALRQETLRAFGVDGDGAQADAG